MKCKHVVLCTGNEQGIETEQKSLNKIWPCLLMIAVSFLQCSFFCPEAYVRSAEDLLHV